VTGEDTAVVFNAANGGGNETLTLAVASGALTLATTANLVVNGDGTERLAAARDNRHQRKASRRLVSSFPNRLTPTEQEALRRHRPSR
jgi:hypothetical protein